MGNFAENLNLGNRFRPPLLFASEVTTSYSSNWITLLLLCTSAPLVLCCNRFDHGSRQVKRDSVDLVTEDYDITLRWRIDFPKKKSSSS